MGTKCHLFPTRKTPWRFHRAGRGPTSPCRLGQHHPRASNYPTAYTWETGRGSVPFPAAAGEPRAATENTARAVPNPYPGDIVFPSSFRRIPKDRAMMQLLVPSSPTGSLTTAWSRLAPPTADRSPTSRSMLWWPTYAVGNPTRRLEPSYAPPPASFQPPELTAKQLYDGLCAQCHGTNFEGTATALPSNQRTCAQGTTTSNCSAWSMTVFLR